MTTPPPPALGTIGWTDLTVPDAVAVCDFHVQVAGWSATPLHAVVQDPAGAMVAPYDSGVRDAST